MTPIQRVQAVLARQQPDRPPVSFWCHFPHDQVHGRPALDAHLHHLERYDLDFLKVMNDNGYPLETPIRTIEDLDSVRELRGDETPFARQLDLLRDLSRELRGRVPMATTIFNAWAVLRHLIRPPTEHLPPDLSGADAPSRRIGEFIEQDAGRVQAALQTIARNLAAFAGRCLDAGADGIFLSVRDDWLQLPGQPPGLYDRLVRPTDLSIIAGASKGWFNILHVCGQAIDFHAFAEYPVHVINWADRAAGPSIAAVKDSLAPAICGGVDNLAALPDGTEDDCRRQVHDALHQAAGRPILIAPGCTYDPHRVSATNLLAVSQAAHTWEGQ